MPDSVFDLLSADGMKSFSLDLQYLSNNFLNVDYSKNFGCVYFNACNKASQFVIFYINIVLRILFNPEYHEVCKFMVDESIENLHADTLVEVKNYVWNKKEKN